MGEVPRTVVELPEFVTFAKHHLTEDERTALVVHLALNPSDGILLRGSGGLRKLRWAAKGKGKSGGVRVVHYFGGEDLPVFLINGFAKSEMENIGAAARNMYRKLLPLLVRAYRERK
ncbi:MAG: addiction module toxin RelE [Alphaproteobacteria bacterium]|nr:addiction module toxin RelE [Alphaproteobacteria bacterium]MBM3950612.1 addiction module toxin RelE [Rhodospirillales bacterium]